jgi:hypothetical protein
MPNWDGMDLVCRNMSEFLFSWMNEAKINVFHISIVLETTINKF